jgi:hypothetical protein
MEEIEGLLEKYEPGHPRMKPDALEQIKKIEKERDEMMKKSQQQQPTFMMGTPDGKQIPLGPEQIVQIIQQQQQQLQAMQQKIMQQDILIKHLTSLQEGGGGSIEDDADNEFLKSKVKIQETVIANLQKQIKTLKGGPEVEPPVPKKEEKEVSKSDPEIHFTIEDD